MQGAVALHLVRLAHSSGDNRVKGEHRPGNWYAMPSDLRLPTRRFRWVSKEVPGRRKPLVNRLKLIFAIALWAHEAAIFCRKVR
jgi:hypothetical protein